MRSAILLPLIAAGMGMAAAPASAQSLLDYVGECVPFARAASGIQIFGDAWTWWDKAEGRYRRGDRPQRGAVIVFERSGRLPLGHVAVVSEVVESRVIMITHANWSRLNGQRGHVEQDVTLTDVSPGNDWSQVRVWFGTSRAMGSTIYPVYGFIYGAALGHSQQPRPSDELSGNQPDQVGALIDAYR